LRKHDSFAVQQIGQSNGSVSRTGDNAGSAHPAKGTLASANHPVVLRKQILTDRHDLSMRRPRAARQGVGIRRVKADSCRNAFAQMRIAVIDIILGWRSGWLSQRRFEEGPIESAGPSLEPSFVIARGR
jgi:hypothetical protein